MRRIRRENRSKRNRRKWLKRTESDNGNGMKKKDFEYK